MPLHLSAQTQQLFGQIYQLETDSVAGAGRNPRLITTVYRTRAPTAS